MYCNKCGNQINSGEKFCNNCGNLITENNPIQEKPKINPNKAYMSSINSYNQNNSTKFNPKNGWRSIFLGIGSIFFALFFFISIPLGVAGLILSSEKPKTKKTKVGKILSIIGIVLSALIIIGAIIINSYHMKDIDQIYYGDGFELKHGFAWEASSSNGQLETLYNRNYGCNMIISPKEEFPPDSVYTEANLKEFYDIILETIRSNGTYKITNESNGFNVLKDNIYYATIDVKKPKVFRTNRLYILISKDNNIQLRFLTISFSSFHKSANANVLKLLKTITIY